MEPRWRGFIRATPRDETTAEEHDDARDREAPELIQRAALRGPSREGGRGVVTA
jgi:hypothetical protein